MRTNKKIYRNRLNEFVDEVMKYGKTHTEAMQIARSVVVRKIRRDRIRKYILWISWAILQSTIILLAFYFRYQELATGHRNGTDIIILIMGTAGVGFLYIILPLGNFYPSFNLRLHPSEYPELDALIKNS